MNIKEEHDWSFYANSVNSALSGWVSDTFDTPEQAWEDWKGKVMKCAKATVGTKIIKSNARLFWNKEIDKLIKSRRMANQFHRYWVRSKVVNPEALQDLWDEYQDRKTQVKEAIKRTEVCKKIRVLTKNAGKGASSKRSYWRLLKRFNKKSGYPIQIKDPLDDTKVLTNPKEISNALKKYWESLAEAELPGDDCSVPCAKDHEYHYMAGDPGGFENVDITEENIQKAISRLKNGKACGVDNIPAEFLKYGGSTLTKSLFNLFKTFILLESFPTDWHQGIIKPIHKAGSKEVLDNYRGITITSNVYKVFASTLESRLMDHLEANNILGELQGAYRKGRRLEDNVYILKGLCALRKSRKTKTHMAFIDISKAFDTVDRQKLFELLWVKGIQGKAWRLLHNLYKNIQNRVIFGEYETDWFYNTNGVKQGCILSPTLFSLVMTDLVQMLSDEGLGIEYRGELIPALLYADDVVLMASSDEELQQMLNTAAKFSGKWKMKFNGTKSKVLTVGKRTDKNKWWSLGPGVRISETEHYKYLGIHFSRSLKDTFHIQNYLSDKGRKLRGYIGSVLSNHGDINRISFGNTLWRHVAMPALSHGCAVWFASSDQSTAKLRSYQYSIGTTILQVHETPAVEAVLGDLGWLPLSMFLDLQRIKYYNYLKNRVPNRRYLLKGVFNDLETGYKSGKDASWSYHKNIHEIFKNVGLDCGYNGNNHDYVQAFKKLQIQNYTSNYQSTIEDRTSLRYYRNMKMHTHQAEYLNNMYDFKGMRLKFQIRTGILSINENRKRWNLSDGICQVCRTTCNQEDVYHFLFECQAYHQYRIQMFTYIDEELQRQGLSHLMASFMASSRLVKLNWLIGDHAYQISTTAGCIYDEGARWFLKCAWKHRSTLII